MAPSEPEVPESVWTWFLDKTYDLVIKLYNYCKDSVERLEKEAEKLQVTRAGVVELIRKALAEGYPIRGSVRDWLGEVNTASEDAEGFRKKNADKSCLCEFCTHPCSHCQLVKEAEQKIQVIKKLQREGERYRVTDVREAAEGGIIPSSDLFVDFDSRNFITNGIMKSLENPNVGVIEICGMVGVGKTTLADEIINHAIKKDMYDTVVKLDLLADPSLVDIQDQIARQLGFTIPSGNDSTRAQFLWRTIENKQKLKQEGERSTLVLERIILMMDNIWKKIELDKIGISCLSRRCKIMLISPIKGVCSRMKADTFTIETLSPEESRAFFRVVAGDIVNKGNIKPNTVDDVADECCGLPIATVAVAEALKTTESDGAWRDVKQQLQKSAPRSIEGLYGEVFRRLESSYKNLETKEAQLIFLLCCLFPEKYDIPIEELMRYGMGLRLFDINGTVGEARNKTHRLVSILTTSFLVITHDQNVKMNDVVRDFGINLLKKQEMVMVKVVPHPINTLRADILGISMISNDDIHEVSNRLQYLTPSSVVYNKLFEGMNDLKVLDICSTRTIPLPQLLQSLGHSLTTVCLNNSKFNDADIPLIGTLTNLEILSLKGTDITVIPEVFKNLVKLRLFDLTACLNLRQISHVVISNLKKLQEFNVSNGRESRDGGLFIELQAPYEGTILRIRTQEAGVGNPLGHAILSANSMILDSPTRFVIEIGSGSLMPLKESPSSSWSRILYIAGIRFQPVDWSVQQPTGITEVLQLCEIEGLSNIFPDLGNHGFNELRYLQVSQCKEMTYLLNMAESPSSIVFNNLESLFMEHIPDIVEICNGTLAAECFCKLNKMCISNCDKMSTIVPSHLLQRLCSLENFEAVSCKSVVYAFDFQRPVIAQGKTMQLSSLKDLRLVDLPEMTQIWYGDAELISLSNLRSIQISDCKKLKNLFTPSIVKGLVKLRTLEVRGCRGMEEIVSDERAETGESREGIAFPDLNKIDLGGLEKLTCFCAGQYTVDFPALELLDIQNCLKMETFGRGDQVTPKLNVIHLQGEKRWKDNLNITVQQFFGERQAGSQLFSLVHLLVCKGSIANLEIYCGSVAIDQHYRRIIEANAEDNCLLSIGDAVRIWTQDISITRKYCRYAST